MIIKSYNPFNSLIKSSKIWLLNNSLGFGTLTPEVKTDNFPTND